MATTTAARSQSPSVTTEDHDVVFEPPRVALSPEVRKYILWSALAIAIVVSVGWIATLVRQYNAETSSESQSSIPWAAKLPVDQWPRIAVPAHGVSGHISVPLGTHPVFPGQGFEIHEVFVGGGECVVNSAQNPCPAKDAVVDIAYDYLKDTSGMTQYVSYAYDPKGQ